MDRSDSTMAQQLAQAAIAFEQQREASAKVAPASSAMVEVFTTGTIVEVFLLADEVATDVWSDGGRAAE